MTENLKIFAEAADCLARARELSALLGAELTENKGEEDACPLLLVGKNGLSLSGGGQEIRGDFSRLLPRLRAGLQNEMLLKAAKFRETEAPFAVDMTAGLGEDSFLLAAAGFRVEMFERDPLIALLLADAMERGRAVPGFEKIIARMTLHVCDSISGAKALDASPDLVLLDPMFPERRTNAQVKKKFQVIHLLEAPCENEEELLRAALSLHPRKIVIKRPQKGAFLAGKKPSYSLEGKAIRYDVIAF